MDKRFFWALLLSYGLWILWHAVVVPPQPAPPEENPQIIENKEDMKIPRPVPLEAGGKSPVGAVVAEPEGEEERVVINNGKIEVELTTRGGKVVRGTILDYGAVLPLADIWNLSAWDHLTYRIESRDSRAVVFRARHNGLVIDKTFSFSDEDFVFSSDILVRNEGKSAYSLNSGVTALDLDLSILSSAAENSRDKNLLEYSVLAGGKVFRKTGAFKFSQKENKSVNLPVEWIGFRDRYFCAIVGLEGDFSGYQIKADTEDPQKMALIALPAVQEIAPGQEMSYRSFVYLGPQKARLLKEYGRSFEKIQVYFRMGFMDAIAKIIEDIMILMYKIVPNWGVAIILVSLLIYGAMYPLTMKSMLSMRKMQSLQPKIAELRVKHEKNPQKLNTEIMQLYKDNNINPMGGCFPLILQMPVFISLYQMIWRSILFKGSDFLWIKDLSEPDRLIVLEQSFPVIGNEINILPFVILILMVVQQKISAKNMATSDPNQIAQQKMMMIAMPVMLLFVFYRIASGLNIYLTVFYLMSSFSQWRVARVTKAG